LFLRQEQEMAEVHGGTAYLFDRAGYFLARSDFCVEDTGSGIAPTPPR